MARSKAEIVLQIYIEMKRKDWTSTPLLRTVTARDWMGQYHRHTFDIHCVNSYCINQKRDTRILPTAMYIYSNYAFRDSRNE